MSGIDLSRLYNQDIKEVDFDGERTLVRMKNGWDITIHNNSNLHFTELPNLVGLHITSLVTSDKNISITLSDGRIVRVGLEDDDFNGPEAMVLYGPDDLVVVWSCGGN